PSGPPTARARITSAAATTARPWPWPAPCFPPTPSRSARANRRRSPHLRRPVAAAGGTGTAGGRTAPRRAVGSTGHTVASSAPRDEVPLAAENGENGGKMVGKWWENGVSSELT